MSVRTTADENLDAAKESVNKAINSLSEIVISNCWGSDEYSEDYSNTIEDILNALLQLRKKFK